VECIIIDGRDDRLATAGWWQRQLWLCTCHLWNGNNAAATWSHVQGRFDSTNSPSSLSLPLAAQPCGHPFFLLSLYFLLHTIPLFFHRRSTQAIERPSSLLLEQALHFSRFTFLLPPRSFSPTTHLTMRHRIPHLWLFLAFACSLLVGLVSAAPTPLSSSTETLYRRQENGSPITGTVVTQTVQTINTFVHSHLMGSPCVLADSLSGIVVVIIVVLPGLLLRHALSR
jgi:hypothetical protein